MCVVVGILAPSFDLSIFNASPEVWLPLQLDPNSRDHPPSLRAAGRFKPGITVDAANAEARLAGMEFGRLFPDAAAPNDTFSLAPFQSLMVSHARPALCAVIGVATLAFSFAKVRFPSLSAKVVGPRCYREFSPSAVLRAPVNARIASAARGAPPASMKDRRMTSAWERNRSSERRR